MGVGTQGAEGNFLGDIYHRVDSVLALPVLALGSEISHWLTSSFSFPPRQVASKGHVTDGLRAAPGSFYE